MKWSRFLTLTLLIGMTWNPYVAYSKRGDRRRFQPTQNHVKLITDYYKPNWCDPDDLSAGDQPPISCKPIEDWVCKDIAAQYYFMEDLQRCTWYL